MKRDITVVAIIWAVFTAIGIYLVATIRFYPEPAADKGTDIEHAFRVLLFLSVPVFSFVMATLIYSLVRSSTFDYPDEDGPPIRGRGIVPVSWLAITSGLTLIMIVYPGIIGINDIFFKDKPPDLVVNVTGVQWAWLFEYPDQNVSTAGELVLPVDRNVKFQVTSNDVTHSFWIPSFLMKIDAVPGQVTEIEVEPTRVGSFRDDPLMRVQCAELCGLDHSQMVAPLTVMTGDEFDAWIREQQSKPTPSPSPSPAAGVQEVTVVGKDLKFDTNEITVEGGRQVDIIFDNQDNGIPHNWALYESQEAADNGEASIVASEIETGPVTQHVVFDPPEPGTYFFRCDVHPTTMTGKLVVQ